MSLSQIDLFAVPKHIIRATEKGLRRAGRSGDECFVLWSGVTSGRRFQFKTAHIPKQTAYQLQSGLAVRVGGEALHNLNVWLFRHGEMLAAQVHAHPGEAFHSDTDDRFPIVTMRGSLSIVASDFCRGNLFSSSTAVYRLDDKAWSWIEYPSRLIRVEA